VSFITGDICNQFDDCYENLVFHVVEIDVITRYMGQRGLEENKTVGRGEAAPSFIPSMGHLFMVSV
jgi:hypothetical protein